VTTGTDDSVVVHRDEVVSLCLAALDAVGARRRVAELLTDAALFAEDRGKTVVGVAHLLDHVDAMADGRLDGRAVPLIGHPSPAVTTSDARGGIAQTGFDGSFPGLVQAAQEYGWPPSPSRERSPAGRSAGSPNAWPTPGSSRSPRPSPRPCSPPGL